MKRSCGYLASPFICSLLMGFIIALLLVFTGCSSSDDDATDAGPSEDGQVLGDTKPKTEPIKDQAIPGDQAIPDVAAMDTAMGPQGTGGTGGEPGHSMQEMTFDGEKRIFAVHVPKTYDEKSPLPLVLHFHGWRPLPAGVSSELTYLWAPTAEAESFIAVAPEALECPELNPTDPFGCFRQDRDGPFVEALVAHLGKLYNLDLDRLFLSGHSGGAFFVQGHGLSNDTTYVSVVTFSGGCISSSDQYGNSCSVYTQLSAQTQRKIPYFVVHHASDQVVPVSYSAELLKLLKAGGHPTSSASEYNAGQNGHSVDPSIVPDVWAWLSGHTLPLP